MPKILILYLAHHTHEYRYTQIHAHTQRYRCHFNILHFLAQLAYMPMIQILYLAHHRFTLAQILRHVHTLRHTHMYRDIDTQI